MIFTGITITFLKQLCFGLWLTLPLLLSLAAGITLLGHGVGRKEGWSRLDNAYHHVRLLPPEPLVVKQPKSTPVEGAATVMQSSENVDRYP
jgi:hypothetical protein